MQRLYFFVPYNISDIQKGIQAGHVALEYARLHGKTPEYKDFIENDKTWIILNGGTTNDFNGTLNTILIELSERNIRHAWFREPDLNNALTAICFLCDWRVYDFETYPDLDEDVTDKKTIDVWKKWIGGDKNVFLRNLIRDKRLA